MLSFLKFVPFLALLAFMSIEATLAQVADEPPPLGAYMDLAAEYTNPKGMNMVISAMNAKTEEMTTLCTNETMGSCSGEALNYDDGATVTVNLTLPDAADANDLLATPNPPVNYRVWICYSAPDIAKRKWRKFDDTIKKDKSCVNRDPKPYNATMPPVTTEKLVLKSILPGGVYTPMVLFQCEGQQDGQYCGVINPKNARLPGKTYFLVETMETRPTNLWVAVLICVFIGPALLIGFLIWERGVLAKQA